MYRWWVFVHLAGVFGFLLAHGVSVGVAFRLRVERNPERVSGLLQLSAASIRVFYASFGVLLLGGVVAGFIGHWWSEGWIWAAIAILVVTSIAMYAMARPFFQRVGLVARAMAGGSKAVSDEQFDSILRSRRPITIAVVGFVGLIAILYLMMFKPILGFGSVQRPPVVAAGLVAVSASGLAFDTSTLTGPAGRPFDLVFDNEDAGVLHNVAIYTNSAATTPLFRGSYVKGRATQTYHVSSLPAGTYFFRCDIHPATMTGTFVVK